MKKVKGTGVERIAAERKRQLDELGYTAKHDDDHVESELALAAVCYAAPDRIYAHESTEPYERFFDPFPWDDGDERPRDRYNELKLPSLGQRIRLLEKAGALIAAEIDRLLRVKQ
jgi:hypothetical protein